MPTRDEWRPISPHVRQRRRMARDWAHRLATVSLGLAGLYLDRGSRVCGPMSARDGSILGGHQCSINATNWLGGRRRLSWAPARDVNCCLWVCPVSAFVGQNLIFRLPSSSQHQRHLEPGGTAALAQYQLAPNWWNLQRESTDYSLQLGDRRWPCPLESLERATRHHKYHMWCKGRFELQVLKTILAKYHSFEMKFGGPVVPPSEAHIVGCFSAPPCPARPVRLAAARCSRVGQPAPLRNPYQMEGRGRGPASGALSGMTAAVKSFALLPAVKTPYKNPPGEYH